MGRPLNKKYFGNRNIGTTSAYDGGLGGEGVASITTATVGSININNTYPSFPALTASAPTLPGGVTATTAVVWEVDTVTIAGGTGYTAGAITSITGLDTYGSPDCRFTVTVDGGGAPSFNAFTNRGEFTSIDGTGITTWAVVKDGDGAAQATIKFRVKSISIVEKGSGYVAVPSLTWGALGGTTPSGQTPSLTTDTGGQFQTGTGGVNVATYQENAIRAYAWNGSSLVAVDIVRQVSSDRYRVNNPTTAADIDADTTALQASFIAKLEETVANGNHTKSTGEREMNIVAFDSDGDTYLVKKLTARKAVVYPMAIARLSTSAGNNFTAGQSVPWKLFEGASADAGYVKIENA